MKTFSSMARTSEIRIKGVSSQLKTDLKNISRNTGLTLAGYVKWKLKEIVAATPATMKRENTID